MIFNVYIHTYPINEFVHLEFSSFNAHVGNFDECIYFFDM